VTDPLLADVDRWPDIFDFERAPEGFLDLILRDLGNPFPFELDTMGKRRLASVPAHQAKPSARLLAQLTR
jgi:phage tail-like protein